MTDPDKPMHVNYYDGSPHEFSHTTADEVEMGEIGEADAREIYATYERRFGVDESQRIPY